MASKLLLTTALCTSMFFGTKSWAAETASTPELAPPNSDVVYQDKPSIEQQAELRDTLALLEQGKIAEVEPRLTKSIQIWIDAGAQPQQLAVLYKYRADVRANLFRFADAVQDYSAAIKEQEKAEANAGAMEDGSGMLCLKTDKADSDADPAYCVYTPTLPDLYLRRGRCTIIAGNRADGITDISKAIAITEEEGARNPWALLYRADAQRGGGDFKAAAKDYTDAARLFKEVGDSVTAEVARAGKALSLYGSGSVDEAVQGMEDVVLRVPTINGELELLLSLADKEADMHAALAAHYWAEGRASKAETEWDRACIRLDAMDQYVSEGDGGASPYDKRDSQGKVMVKIAKPVACKKYRNSEWVRRERGWPPSLISKLESFFSKSVQN